MTRLTARYWRYILRKKGKGRTRELFALRIKEAKGRRKMALMDIYNEVFYEC
jgi:hypothetical protein